MDEHSDPYRYGQPARAEGTRATGKQIVAASWGLLRQDRELIVLPLIGGLSALAAAAVLFVPGWLVGRAVGNTDQAAGWTGGVLALFTISVVGIYFQAALVIGANQRADGATPTIGGVLRQTWQLRGPVLGWAVLTTTVGVALRAAEQRLGIVGKLVGFLGGLAWAIASFLAVPVVVAEGLGPVAAVRRSGQLIRRTWGTGLRTTLRFGLLQIMLLIPVLGAIVLGAAAMASGPAVGVAVGAVVLIAGVIALVALATLFGAVTTYARAMIYRYATGRPVPGLPAELLAGAFGPKRRRR